jgi:putative ABC transport system permease protein
MSTLLQDLKYGLRMLARNPGFTAVAVLTLALGIGANTAIFSVVNAVLLRPLAFRNPDRLVKIWETAPKYGLPLAYVSPPSYLNWQKEATLFEDVAANTEVMVDPTVLTGNGNPEVVVGQRVSANYFGLLGVQPLMGRTFLAEEDQSGQDRVAVLSYNLWRRRFAADANILGRPLSINSESFTIIGVMPPGLRSLVSAGEREPIDIWMPNPFRDGWMSGGYLGVTARLKPGVSLKQAQAEMDAIVLRAEQGKPERQRGFGVIVRPLRDDLVRDARQSLLLLAGAVGFVLLIACINVAGLMIARGMARQKEIAIRAALGASRMRMMRQLLTETMLVALLGGLLGLLITSWCTDALIRLSPATLALREEISVDLRVLGFTFLLSVLAGLISGLAPALGASKPNVNEALKEGGRRSAQGVRQRLLRRLLVISEIALATILLSGAGLLLNSFLRLNGTDCGFNASHALTFRIELPRGKYAEVVGLRKYEKSNEEYKIWRARPRRTAFIQQVLQRLEALPGVEAAATTTFLPLTRGQYRYPVRIEGRLPHRPEAQYYAPGRAITPRYFDAMGIPLLRGRCFTEADTAGGPGVAIIDQRLARRFWPSADPLGSRLMFQESEEEQEKAYEIVGIVGAVRDEDLMTKPMGTIYIPYLQRAKTYIDWDTFVHMGMSFVVRAKGDPARLAQAAQQAVWDVDPDQPVTGLATMEEFVSETLSEPRFLTLLVGVFAAVAVLLATVGIYGVMSFLVGERTHEIGVRRALGAKDREVLKLVVRQGFEISLAGLAVGMAGALALTHVLSRMLVGVSATDPATLAGVMALLAAVALLACYIPARRAAKVDPLVALRYE